MLFQCLSIDTIKLLDMSDTGEINAVDGLREGEGEQVDRDQTCIEEVSVRERVLTDKGREYQVSVTKGRAESCKRKWSSVTSKIKKGLKIVISPFELEPMSSEVIEAFHQYYVEYTKLVELEPEKSEELNEELEHNQRVHHELLESIECKRKELKNDKGSICFSKRSRHSRVSSTSSRSSAQRKQEAAAKVET